MGIAVSYERIAVQPYEVWSTDRRRAKSRKPERPGSCPQFEAREGTGGSARPGKGRSGGLMQNHRVNTDAPMAAGRDDAKRVGKGAIARLALGAPFVAATPATAQGNGNGHGHANA